MIAEISSDACRPGPQDRVITLQPWQADFIASKARHPAMVSAWATGKTMSGIEKCRIDSERYPKNLGVVFRTELKDLLDSTCKDFELYTGIKINSARNAVFPNGSELMFRHAEELNNIQNINLGFFLIEQAEEIETDNIFFMLHGRLRRAGVPHWGAVIASTKGHNWIYKLWKANVGQDKDFELHEATTFDNLKNLSPDYIESLRKLEKRKPKIYNRFVMNSWEESDTVDQIIQSSWIKDATEKISEHFGPVRRIVSIDVARGGGDASVFYALQNYETLDREEWDTRNTMELVGRAVLFAGKHGIEDFAVDEIGVGGGVADRLQELGKRVIFVNAAKREGVPAPYFNRRSEILGSAAQLFEDKKVKVDKKYEKLVEQLSWTKWKPMKSSGVLQAESKDDIRVRYGSSPDDADSYLNGLWSVMQVPEYQAVADKGMDGWVHPRYRKEVYA